MKGTIFLTAFLVATYMLLHGQLTSARGCREVEMTADFSNDGQRAGDLTRWFSLRPYTPYPKNQGSINSCIGWAMGYAAMTTQRAFEKRITNRKEITDHAFSALFIYN